MNLHDTLTWLEKLTALAVALQSFELLSVRASWSDSGLWKWAILKKEYPRALRLILTPFLCESGFTRLQHLRLVLSAFVLIFPAATPFNGLFLAGLFFASYLTSIRWRGAFNGGSDSLTLINLLFLSLSGLASSHEFSRVCLIAIAINLAATFALAGLAKLRDRDWRSGRALPLLLTISNYRPPNSPAGALASPPLALFMSWFVIVFELTFPLAFFAKSLAIGFVAIALIFHFINARVFGLNRFLHIWGATYPVVFYFAATL
jgi:hypothetical protein